MLKTIYVATGLFLACVMPVAAQKLQLSAEGGFQQSWIPDYTERAVMPGNYPLSPPGYSSTAYVVDIATAYQEKPGGYLKGNLSYALNDRLQLYHNLGLHLLRFQPRVELQNMRTFSGEGLWVEAPEAAPEDRMIIGNDQRSGKTSMLYLSQELGARYRLLPKIWIGGGVNLSHRLYSQVWVQQLSIGSVVPGQQPVYAITTEKDKSGANFNDQVLGVHIGGAYDLCSHLSLSLGLQHSLTPVYTANDAASRRAKANLLSLGVQYKLKRW
ncbi:hypothetical protein [Cesiribacter sp. SM1]|uniref:hypothetical protein n=1 Tax=Cesiribacter sp. SM1 TaxID=2861196 RepID=UPI001CD2465C|nr:hypothetical protein [Cesiribacter sp. SM1]